MEIPNFGSFLSGFGIFLCLLRAGSSRYVFRGNVVGEPDFVFREIKLESCFVHFTGLYDEYSEFAMSFADFGGGFYISGEMDMLTTTFD